jgi:hypothetical protein
MEPGPHYPDEDEPTSDAAPDPIGVVVAGSVGLLALLMMLGALLLADVR